MGDLNIGLSGVAKDIFLEIVPLACYVAFVYFSFCDGFNLKPSRKITWGVYFVAFSLLAFFAYGRFELRMIIMLSSVLAIILAFFQKKENKLLGKK